MHQPSIHYTELQNTNTRKWRRQGGNEEKEEPRRNRNLPHKHLNVFLMMQWTKFQKVTKKDEHNFSTSVATAYMYQKTFVLTGHEQKLEIFVNQFDIRKNCLKIANQF